MLPLLVQIGPPERLLCRSRLAENCPNGMYRAPHPCANVAYSNRGTIIGALKRNAPEPRVPEPTSVLLMLGVALFVGGVLFPVPLALSEPAISTRSRPHYEHYGDR